MNYSKEIRAYDAEGAADLLCPRCGNIKLVAIKDRGTDVPAPPGYGSDRGQTPAPIAVASVGLNFLRQEVANLALLR